MSTVGTPLEPRNVNRTLAALIDRAWPAVLSACTTCGTPVRRFCSPRGYLRAS
jgi:hypothetical protein